MDTAQALVAWFRATARSLPWRGPFPRDPYRVLVSEVMLQQTQVERVTGAFEAFLLSFPTLEALAAAPEEAVVHAFSGLGYYRRARALHATARAVTARGAWPGDPRTLATLPGLGTYASAAVAAFAFDGEDPPVDGNVARVAARCGALPLPLGSGALQRQAVLWARTVRDGYNPAAEVWEALIELGALVCTPSAPSCPACPLAPGCAAREAGDPARYPLARKVRPTEAQTWVALWAVRPDGHVLFVRRPEADLLGGLWLPPVVVVEPGKAPDRAAARLAGALGLAGSASPRPPVRHSITFRRVTVLPFVLHTEARVAERDDTVRWIAPASPGLPTSSLTAKLTHACAPEARAATTPAERK